MYMFLYMYTYVYIHIHTCMQKKSRGRLLQLGGITWDKIAFSGYFQGCPFSFLLVVKHRPTHRPSYRYTDILKQKKKENNIFMVIFEHREICMCVSVGMYELFIIYLWLLGDIRL